MSIFVKGEYMKNIKVSVIIPTYKRSASICRAVDSLLVQTLEEIEVIVVDDNGINTPTGEVLGRICGKRCNVKK